MAAKKTQQARLLYGVSECDADLLYLTGFFAPDAFIAFQVKGASYALFSKLEYARALKESSVDHVLSLETWRDAAQKLFPKSKVGIAEIIACFAKHHKLKALTVPHLFPTGLTFQLQELGIRLDVQPAPFFSKRLIKDEAAAKKMRYANSLSAASFRVVEEILKTSTIKNKKLYYQGRMLTSEYLRLQVEIACLEKGGAAHRPIVAGGDQACDPHCIGAGPLRANELIIVDVFPRVTNTGYYGDMTRTFLKGTANEAQKALVTHVRAAQKTALEKIKARVTGHAIHKSVCDYFASKGFETKQQKGVPTGFIHSTGHGLGLEVHEPLRLAPNTPALKSGMVVTVEPGLYYPGVGGVRIEDVAWVRPDGMQLLSKYHYRWHLK